MSFTAAEGESLAAIVYMRKLLPALAFSALLFGSASPAHAQVSFGIRIGPPPAPRGYRVPPQPSPNHEWVEGHWSPQGSHYRWHDGRWAQPPRQGAYWQEPYYANDRYFSGSWEGGNARTAPNGRSARRQQRDQRQNDHR